MAKSTKKISRDILLLYELGSLRHVKRTWQQFFQDEVANDAEHMFRVAWIALIIARQEGVKNEEKILKMALMHDIGETRSPDTNYLSKLYSSRNEMKAITDMLDGTSIKEDFLLLYKEYEERKTIESKIVKDADNLDVDFELQEFAVKGNDFRKLWPRTTVREALFTKTAKKLWDELYKTDPRLWHIDAYKDKAK